MAEYYSKNKNEIKDTPEDMGAGPFAVIAHEDSQGHRDVEVFSTLSEVDEYLKSREKENFFFDVHEVEASGLSVVQRTQIREALKSFGSECSQAAIAWARTPEFSEPIESREKRIDAVLSAIGLILGDTDET